MLPPHRCRSVHVLGQVSLLVLFVAVIALGSAPPSWAQGGNNGGVGKNNFGIDGNLLANSPANGPNPGDPSTADDWLDGLAGPGEGVLNKNGTPKDPVHTRHEVDGTRLNADLTVFEGSNKIDDNPNTYEWKDGSVPQKDDIQNCLFHFSIESNGSLWVNAAGDRLATNGDSYIDVELLQNSLTIVPDPNDPTHGTFNSLGPDGGRTVGDLLLTIELVRGGTQADVFARRWVAGGGPEGFHYESFDPGADAFVAANVESTVVVPYGAFGNTTYEINAFGEMSANLSELIEGLECFGIKTVFIRTKSSQSEDAELKDLCEPMQLNICLDQEPPSITCAPVISPIECPGTPSFPEPDVSDNCDTDPSVTFEDVTTPGECAQEFRVTRTWTATDACGNSATCIQIVEVQDTTAPTITCATAKSPIECPATPVFPEPDVSDLCDENPRVTFVDEETPGKCPQEFSVTRTWTATDACGNSQSCSQTVLVQDTTAPDITCPTAKSPIECPNTPSFPDPDVSDLCDPDPRVTFVDEETPGKCPQEFSVTRTWTATDACGNAASCSQTVLVQDTTAPDITCPTAKSPIECPNTPSFPDPDVSDLCDPNPRVTFVDEETPGKCPQEFSVTRTWTATDACGNSQSCSQTVLVQDTTPPDITCPTAKSPIECPNTPSFPDPDVSDLCDPDPRVTFEDKRTDGKCPQEYSITRTWTATDACGNSQSCSQTVEVQDTTDPTITCPAAIEVACGEEVPPPDTELVVCSDSCDDSPSTEFVSDVSNGAVCPDPEIITRTYRCTDACGNSADCTQTITVLCCPEEQFCSLTQGFYGNNGSFNGQGSLALIQSLLAGSDLVVGKPGRSITIPQAAAQCIINRLPAGGTAGALPDIGDDTLVSPACQTTPPIPVDQNGNFRNVLLGQTIALGLNLRFDTELGDFELVKQFCTQGSLPGPDGLFGTNDDVPDPNSPIQSFTIPNAVITALANLGLSNDVEGLFELANRALAGQATGGATAAQINQAVDSINRGFDKCRFLAPCPLGIVAGGRGTLETLSAFGIQPAEAASLVGPAQYELGQSHPNPFNPHTQITMSLPEATSWSLDIYNVSGQLVRTFDGQVDGASYVPIVWDGRNRAGEPVAPGVYLYRMQAGPFSATKKMILIK